MLDFDAFLADSASNTPGQKLHVLGIGWNVIGAAVFPATHPRVTVAVIVHVPYTDTNAPHTLSVRLDTEDGEPVRLGVAVAADGAPQDVFQLGGQFNVGRPPMLVPGDEQLISLALEINQLRFDGPGKFSWVVTVDDSIEKRLPMRVIAAAPQFGPML